MIDMDSEMRNIQLAEKNVDQAIKEYNKGLKLSFRSSSIIQLYYYFKKLDTLEKMTPKGNWYNSEEKSKRTSQVRKQIIKLGTATYPSITEFEPTEWESKIKEKIDEDIIDYLPLIEGFTKCIKDAYKQYCGYVYTIIPISGLTELKASHNRENHYKNEIKDGIFARATVEDIKFWTARANGKGVIQRGDELQYGRNPFAGIEGDKIMLVKPVSVYRSNVDAFDPQINFTAEGAESPRFIYSAEWVSHTQREACEEWQVDSIPLSFLQEYKLFYIDDDGNRVEIFDREKILEEYEKLSTTAEGGSRETDE